MFPLCFCCGGNAHMDSSCSATRSVLFNKRRTLIEKFKITKISHSIYFQTDLKVSSHMLHVSEFIEFGRDTELIDQKFARGRGLNLNFTSLSYNVLTLDGQILNLSHLQTLLSLGGNHHEEIMFTVINSPKLSIILGATWLMKHNPILSSCFKKKSNFSFCLCQ